MWDDITREERIKRIRAGVAEGLSSTQIAARIGGCSRNAVIGLALRAKIPLNADNRTKYAKARDEARERPKPVRKERVDSPQVAAAPAKPKLAPPKPSAVILPFLERSPPKQVERSESGYVHLLNITDRHCRWPMWEDRPIADQLFYCGEELPEGFSPYCAKHRLRARGRPTDFET